METKTETNETNRAAGKTTNNNTLVFWKRTCKQKKLIARNLRHIVHKGKHFPEPLWAYPMRLMGYPIGVQMENTFRPEEIPNVSTR